MRTIDVSALRAFEEVVRKDVPEFTVQFKDQSKLMGFFGFLSRPFNADFMTRYTTTWGNTVYFPTEEFYLSNPSRSFRILSHEYVHLLDFKNHPATFNLSFAWPQWMAVPPMIAYAVLAWPHPWIVLVPFVGYLLACAAAMVHRILMVAALLVVIGGTAALAIWLTGWWALVLAGALIPLIPWPSYWRTKWELRGYGMNVALVWWMFQVHSEQQIESIVQQFTGPGYYFMCWSGDKIRTRMEVYYQRAKSGTLLQEEPYNTVHSFLQEPA